jgi:hypothetical protein
MLAARTRTMSRLDLAAAASGKAGQNDGAMIESRLWRHHFVRSGRCEN